MSEQEGEARSLKDILSQGMRGVVPPELNDQQRARLIWAQVNGELERKHTCGVYLRAPRAHEKYPTLIVYVDSSSIIQDFTTDRMLYVGRLAHRGFTVADVQFKLSREKVAKKESPTEQTSKQKRQSLPKLSKSEEESISEQTAQIPEAIRETVREAMSSSLRWDKLQDTDKR